MDKPIQKEIEGTKSDTPDDEANVPVDQNAKARMPLFEKV
jgi:hypothetical protein